jgi:hypothetical protein
MRNKRRVKSVFWIWFWNLDRGIYRTEVRTEEGIDEK